MIQIIWQQQYVPKKMGGGTYYLVNEVKVIGNYNKSNHEASRILDSSGIAPTIKENHGTVNAIREDEGGVAIKNKTSKGYLIANDGDGIDIGGRMEYHRGTVQKGMAQTLKTQNDVGTIQNMRIRKLTPLECWRLMGFSDEDFYKAKEVNTDSQLYKQAGNSIVVNVLMAIFGEML